MQAINNEFSGDIKKLLTAVVYAVISPSEFFATKVNKAIKGLGTNTAVLNRVLAARHGVDMPQIKEIYQWKYKVSMKEDIIGDTSGMYQKLCLFVAEY